MTLASRLKRFDDLKAQFSCAYEAPLIAVHKIEPNLFRRLESAVCTYMSKCLPDRKFLATEAEILAEFVRIRQVDRSLIKNCTPNGMLVPKRHTILEYNSVVQAYAEIIESLKIGQFIHSWHVPLNVRYKDGEVIEENLKRHHPTEHIHTDSWAGESPASVTTLLPILGDTEHNNVSFYVPPDNFQEEWLGPLPTYQAGASIAAQYTPIKLPFLKGHIYLADFATLHSSSREKGAGPRTSIDTTFALTRSAQEHGVAEEKMHPWRKEERVSPSELFEIGKSKLFMFPDDENQHVDSQGGFKHPSNLKLINLT